MFNDENKEIINTINKLIMEDAIKHAQEVREGVVLLRKIISIREYKGVLVSCGLLGSNGRKLTQCVREMEEKSNIKWKGRVNR